MPLPFLSRIRPSHLIFAEAPRGASAWLLMLSLATLAVGAGLGLRFLEGLLELIGDAQFGGPLAHVGFVERALH